MLHTNLMLRNHSQIYVSNRDKQLEVDHLYQVRIQIKILILQDHMTSNLLLFLILEGANKKAIAHMP